MSDFRDVNPDDERDVPVDEDEAPEAPPTLDERETVEQDVDELDLEERESAIEAGEILPGD